MIEYILYNPTSNNGGASESIKELLPILKNVKQLNVLEGINYPEFFSSLEAEDTITLVGGDGTLNHFVNDIQDIAIKNAIYYYPTGTGNDFYNDIYDLAAHHNQRERVLINDYIKDLPIATVNGKDYRFVNNVGYGLDGYCCEEGDRQRAASKEKISYTKIAIGGLMGKYHPSNATVTIDGETTKYQGVWLAPTMNGRFYGGGMMMAPMQDRLNKEHCVTACVVFNATKFKILTVFPSIFKGTHVKHSEIYYYKQGHNITVTFDRPCALQIDGETFLNVTTYSVRTK